MSVKVTVTLCADPASLAPGVQENVAVKGSVLVVPAPGDRVAPDGRPKWLIVRLSPSGSFPVMEIVKACPTLTIFVDEPLSVQVGDWLSVPPTISMMKSSGTCPAVPPG